MAAETIRLQISIPKYVELLVPAWFFFAFFTGIKLLPQLATNVGLFEVIGLLITTGFFASGAQGLGLARHPLVFLTTLMSAAALISQLQVPSHLRRQGLIQLIILLFLLAFLVLFSALINKYHVPPAWLLGIVVVCVLVSGIIVVVSGVGATAGSVAGPFRNRAHMASYMLTAFWICLIALFWPGLKTWLRYTSLCSLILALYSVAISGRRSVYLSLFLGLGGLVAALLVAQKGKRIRWLMGVGVAIGFLVGFYVAGDRLTGQTAFFHERVGLIDDRLRSFLGDEGTATEDSFFALQREGVRSAVRASPILGIGWGGFPKSRYSPTGHEVHSTPLRFLAELGILGFSLYVCFMGFLLIRSAKLFLLMRASPYGNSYLVLALALWSMSVSYIYNRHMTERTFWIFLAIFLAMETFAADWHTLMARFASQRAERNKVATAGVRTTFGPRVKSLPQAGRFR